MLQFYYWWCILPATTYSIQASYISNLKMKNIFIHELYKEILIDTAELFMFYYTY